MKEMRERWILIWFNFRKKIEFSWFIRIGWRQKYSFEAEILRFWHEFMNVFKRTYKNKIALKTTLLYLTFAFKSRF
jgi:hypothetical protein